MTKKQIIAVLALLLTANALHLQQTHQATNFDLPGGTVALIADNGQYLSVFHNCGNSAYSDSAGFSASLQTWVLQVVQNQVAFRGSNGNYLGRCRDCWDSKYKDSAFVASSALTGFALWTPVRLDNGKYGFISDNGKYLGRCNRCTSDSYVSDLAFI